ncbi:unnamed protein product [Notodromas monacha]|uniref:Nuclear pore complex protein Nup85 n=1 Tax=Notodromas monacha TaxID=399045 RepID=A0A7R9GGF5_9CRUS|nr:unnamed protein product [Notodromas monacha]CAG0921648.1 unnamed protein product [Notodromas monacha]
MECFGLEAGLKVAFLRPDKRDAFVFGGDDNIFVGSTAYNLGSKLMRALARDSASVFNDVQKMLKSEKSGRNTSLSNFLNASRKYRSLINACVRNFCEEETPDEDTAAMGAVMLKIDFVWHLTEILYLETGSGQLSLLRDLRDWVQLHMSEKRVDLVSDVMEFETNDDDSLAEDHPKYWDAVHYALLHLDFPTVQDLLGQHSLRSEPAFTEAVELLTEAHKLVTDRIDRATAEQFIVERAALKANCQTLLKSGHFLSYPQLAFIPKLHSKMAGFAVTVLLLVLVVHPDASSGRCHVQDGRLHCTEACDADAVRAADFDGRIVLTGRVLDFGCLDFFGITQPARPPEDVLTADYDEVTIFYTTSHACSEFVNEDSCCIDGAGDVNDGGLFHFFFDGGAICRHFRGHRGHTGFQHGFIPTSKPSIIVSVLKNLPETQIHSGDHANVTLTVVEGRAVLGAEFATELFSNWAIGLISGLGVTVFGLAAGWITWCLRKKVPSVFCTVVIHKYILRMSPCLLTNSQ